MMAETFIPRGSSNVRAVEYDPESEDMTVHFHRGGSYMYRNVRPHLYRGITQAESPGEYLQRHIKGRHLFEKV